MPIDAFTGDEPLGREEQIELVGTHLRLTGLMYLGRFGRLTDLINAQSGYIRVHDANLLRRNGDPTTLVLPELMIDKDEISFIAQEDPEAPAEASGLAGAGGMSDFGEVTLTRKPRQFVLFTPGHTVTGSAHVYGETDLAGFVDTDDPRFIAADRGHDPLARRPPDHQPLQVRADQPDADDRRVRDRPPGRHRPRGRPGPVGVPRATRYRAPRRSPRTAPDHPAPTAHPPVRCADATSAARPPGGPAPAVTTRRTATVHPRHAIRRGPVASGRLGRGPMVLPGHAPQGPWPGCTARPADDHRRPWNQRPIAVPVPRARTIRPMHHPRSRWSSPTHRAPIAILSALAVMAVALVALAPVVLARSQQATIADSEYKPNDITINVNEVVTWISDSDKEHTVTADDGSFDSGRMARGEAFANVFSRPGTYTYHCIVYGFTGKVTVEGSGPTPRPTAAPTPTPPPGTLPPSFVPAETPAASAPAATADASRAAGLRDQPGPGVLAGRADRGDRRRGRRDRPGAVRDPAPRRS